jgi:lysophospholipase L1-like esterase
MKKNHLLSFLFALFLTVPSWTATLITVGDSTVASYDNPSSGKHGWGQMLPKFLNSSKVRAVNWAKGGRTAESYWKEGHWSKAQKERPSIVFIQFGHNDSNPEKGTNVNEYTEYLRDYAQDCAEMKADLIFVTPPRRYRFKNGKPSTELSPFASAMKKVAAERNLPVVDLYTITGKLMESEGSKFKENFATDDTTHFNTKGATRIAEIVASEAKKLSPAFAKVAK